MHPLATTPHFDVFVERSSAFFFVRRTSAPFASIDDLRRSFEVVERSIFAVAVPNAYRLLVDTRDGPVRNDAEFEEAFAQVRRRVVRGAAKMAIVVRSAVGKLNIQRHARIDGVEVGIFETHDEALDYLGVRARIPPSNS